MPLRLFSIKNEITTRKPLICRFQKRYYIWISSEANGIYNEKIKQWFSAEKRSNHTSLIRLKARNKSAQYDITNPITQSMHFTGEVALITWRGMGGGRRAPGGYTLVWHKVGVQLEWAMLVGSVLGLHTFVIQRLWGMVPVPYPIIFKGEVHSNLKIHLKGKFTQISKFF